jgi:seryl-tRNA synthetase
MECDKMEIDIKTLEKAEKLGLTLSHLVEMAKNNVSIDDIEQKIKSVKKIDSEIQKLQEKIRTLKEKRENELNDIPEFIRDTLFRTRRNSTGGGRKKYVVKDKNGNVVNGSLKTVFQEVYGKQVSWKSEAMIAYLEKHGYKVEIIE